MIVTPTMAYAPTSTEPGTSHSSAIAEAQEAGRIAGSEWELGSMGIQDHRLRSLMNFERDVVKSTWEDEEALPQWRAFLDAYDAVGSTGADSFKSARGTTVTVPAEEIADYLNAKAEELNVVARLVADAVSGNELNLSSMEKDVFSMMSSNLAHEINCLVQLVSRSTAKKGGA